MLSVIVLIFMTRRWPRFIVLRDLVLSCALFCAGGARMSDAIRDTDVSLLPFADSRDKAMIVCIVDAYPMDKPGRISFRAEVLSARTVTGESRPMHARASVTIYGDRTRGVAPLPRRGDTLLLRCKLISARPARNPGGFDAREYARRLGYAVSLSCSAGDVRLLGHEANTSPLTALVDATRDAVLREIDALFPAERAPVIAGLLLGDRGMIDEDVIAAMRDAGVIHVMAVSGLHVGIILSLVWYPLGRFRLALRAPVAIGLLWLYTVLSGMAPPVLRATIASTVVIGGAALQRRAPSLNAMAAAGIVILLADPNDLFLPGFQLSFAAAASIILFQTRFLSMLHRFLPAIARIPGGESVLGLLSMTAVAQAGTLPFLAAYFGQFSLVSFAANLIVVPVIFVVTACAVIAIVLAQLFPAAAVLYACAADASLWIVIQSSAILASLPHAVIDIPVLPPPVTILYLLALLVLLGWMRRTRVRMTIALLLAAVACVMFEWSGPRPPAPGLLRVTFLDVGQGDAVFIETPSGRRLLIDTGPSTGGFDTGEKVLLPYFRARGIGALDALLLTHPDDDHIGGAPSLLRGMHAASLIVSRPWPDSPLTRSVDSSLRAERVPMRAVQAGDMISLDPELRLYVLSPPRAAAAPEGANNISVVLMLVHGEVCFLLTGDAEEEAEILLSERYADLLHCTVLKCGHHGSATSTSPPLLSRAHPAHAVISCGRLNKFKHPSPLVLARLVDSKARVHRTDIDGAIIFESDGKSVSTYEWNGN